MNDLKQSSTAQPLTFLMLDSADSKTPKTGLSPTVTISKNGAAFAAPAGAVSEIGVGWYKVAGNATDTNTLGPLLLHATATGADPADDRWSVVAYDPQAATNLGLSGLPTANPGAASGLLIAGANAATTFATLTSTGAFSINGTSQVAQTGDSFARIGATGSGLSSLAPASTALSSAVWTSTIAGRIDENISAAKTLSSAYDAAKTAATQTSVNAIPTNPLTTLGATAPAGWINAAAIAAAALNGKGDWSLVGSAMTLTIGERDAIGTEVEAHLIDEADGQTIVNAIVGAIGNTNLSQAAVVAAVRADLERNGGLLFLIDGKTTNLPASPAAVGSAMTLASGAILAATFATDAITAGAISSGAITEIQFGLMLSSSYTAPANADVAAIKAKTDALPADPADASDIATAFSTVNTTLGTLATYVDSEVAAIKTTTDQLATVLESAGGGLSRFTTGSLVNAPSGGGGGGATDWSTGEREQIRHRLGIDGTAVAPSATPSLATATALSTFSTATATTLGTLATSSALATFSTATGTTLGNLATAAALSTFSTATGTTLGNLATSAALSTLSSAIAAGVTLTAGERTTLANVIEAEMIDETDSEKVLTAITNKIASVNPDLGGLTVGAIAAAVWANGSRTLSTLAGLVPANFAALGINSSGHVSRVTLVDTTTTNTDMRGTNSALLASSYTVPPTAAAIATLVNSTLSSAHGSGDWSATGEGGGSADARVIAFVAGKRRLTVTGATKLLEIFDPADPDEVVLAFERSADGTTLTPV